MNVTPRDLVPDVVVGCLDACQRCEAVVDAVVEQDAAAFHTVGPHLRHCIDHFQLLLDGWGTGRVDYDARARDARLEQEPQAVRDAFGAIARSLAALPAGSLPRELTITQSVAPGRPPHSSSSRLERELAFLSGHTIHHIAIMVLAARAAGVEIPTRLAVAFSTEAHRDAFAMNR
jgi:uncharacterized damage-inducible protein DinB